MSILIKGMKKPDKCGDCELLPEEIDQDEQWKCPITKKIVQKYIEERKGKPSNCPLVEVPEPHGRLIEAPEIEWEAVGGGEKEISLGALIALAHKVDNAPTVIEAEEENE